MKINKENSPSLGLIFPQHFLHQTFNFNFASIIRFLKMYVYIFSF